MTPAFRIFCILCATGTLFFSSCRKKDDVVPSVYVDIYLYSSNPSFVNLNVTGGWIYISGGVQGIIVYRKSNEEFLAFDRNCTYKPLDNCAIAVDSTNVAAEDKCCGSKFQITDGSVVKGPASVPLKQYNTSFDGSVLHIYNN